MIIKTMRKHTSDFKDLVQYVLTDGGKQDPFHSFACFHNLYGIDSENIAKQFKENAKHINSRGTVLGYHEVISWHPDSERYLTEDKMAQIAEKYIELRGIKGLCLAKPHYSTSHPHIHFIFSAMDYHKQKSLRLNNAKFYGIRKEMEQFQNKLIPEINTEVYQHFGTEQPLKSKTNKHLSTNEHQLLKRTNKSKTIKGILSKTILDLLNDADNIGEAKDQLLEFGIEFYQRNGLTKGVKFKAKNYRFKTLDVEHNYIRYMNRMEELKRIQKQTIKSKSLER